MVLWRGDKKSQGGGPEQHVEVLFRMFFSVAKEIRARAATQRAARHHFLQPSSGEWAAGRGSAPGHRSAGATSP